jgi:uncharacterized membrane protein YfcA
MPDPVELATVLIAAFAAALLGGIAGYGTGLILPPVLAPLVGGAAVVPVVALSAIFSNAGRMIAWRREIDRELALKIGLAALPGTVLSALFYASLSGPAALILIGVFLLALVPVRWLARRANWLLPRRHALWAGAAYGFIVGGTSGSGLLLLNCLMAAGLTGAATIATDAFISIVTGLVKIATFLLAGALDLRLVLLGLLIGAISFPAGFLAKRVVGEIGGRAHLWILDAAVALGAILMIKQGLQP